MTKKTSYVAKNQLHVCFFARAFGSWIKECKQTPAVVIKDNFTFLLGHPLSWRSEGYLVVGHNKWPESWWINNLGKSNLSLFYYYPPKNFKYWYKKDKTFKSAKRYIFQALKSAVNSSKMRFILHTSYLEKNENWLPE